jgi:hypothetical protein
MSDGVDVKSSCIAEVAEADSRMISLGYDY